MLAKKISLEQYNGIHIENEQMFVSLYYKGKWLYKWSQCAWVEVSYILTKEDLYIIATILFSTITWVFSNELAAVQNGSLSVENNENFCYMF